MCFANRTLGFEAMYLDETRTEIRAWWTYAVLGVLRIQQAQINRNDKRIDLRANARVLKTGAVKELSANVNLVALGEPGNKR